MNVIIMEISAIFTQIKSTGTKFVKNECGVHTIEYAIIMSGITMVVSVIFFDDDGPVKHALTELFDKLKHKLSSII